jgi:putative transposase
MLSEYIELLCQTVGLVDTRYRVSAGAVFSLKYHFLWCPKYRKAVLTGPVQKRLRRLLQEKAAELGTTIHALEIRPDHVHLFFESDARLAPAHLAAQFKGSTSKILRDEFSRLRSRLPTLWSRSYYVGSVGTVSQATVKKYISQQKTRAQSV